MKYSNLHISYKIVKMFEEEIANYTNAPYAIAINNCTNALFLCCEYLKIKEVEIPSKTYISVPEIIIHAGGEIIFDKKRNNWEGIYQLSPYPIYDSAKRFTSNMYIPNTFMCLSFHHKKHLKIGTGGMILTDNLESVEWFNRKKYFGRDEKLLKNEIDIISIGYMMYMYPEDAARGLTLMSDMDMYNPDLINKYRDLTDFSVFKNCKII